MKTVTISLDDALAARARAEAAKQGKSLSRFVSETLEARIGGTMTQSEALARFLAGPPMDLLDENGRPPTRDRIYGDDAIC